MSLDDPSATSEMFLSRALQKILAEKDIKRKDNAPLKEACEKALAAVNEELKDHGQAADTQIGVDCSCTGEFEHPDAAATTAGWARERREVFHAVSARLRIKKLAHCRVRTALDSLQKMMAYGHINSLMLAEVEGFPDAMRLVDLIVETVCKCFVGEATDETVQIQIIKALLTAVTSNVCDIHEGTLLKAVRTCYNVYLTSRNLVNQTTAKATLTQMISVIYRRMEDVSDEIDSFLKENTNISTPLDDADVEVTKVIRHPDTIVSSEASVDADTDAHVPQQEPATAENIGDTMKSIIDGIVDQAAAEAAGTKIVADAVAEIPQEQQNPPIELNLKDPRYGHVYRKDAFLVLRSMCKLSMKDLPEKEVDAKSHELRSKILSLELQLAILQNAGDWFQRDPLFIDAIKQYLCVALSKNGVSHVPEVFELALAIFMVLLTKFKHHLKMQIEVFLKDILFSMLETSLSSFRHKWLVMVCLSKITNDAQTVIDLYLNYDCDEYLANVFERMINNLSRVAQGRSSSELGATPQQELAMKVKGVECLSSIMRCLEEWCEAPEDLDELSQSVEKDEEQVLDRSRKDEASQFEERKQKKAQLESGFELFAKKPKKGLQFFIDNGFLDNTTEAIAQFLLHEERLDRAAIGELLGEPDDRYITIMHKYVDVTDFSKTKTFLNALRHFLGNFRLPGEAQKIDRLMEKFASRYFEMYKDQGIFASADAAYVLAYSVIMLTTDLHSSKVKTKITKEDFVKMTRGINDNRDLPHDFVESIYDDISKQEIKLKAGHGTPSRPSVDIQNARARQALYHAERKNLEASAEEAMARAREGKTKSEFLTATHIEHVRPLFKTVWASLMAGFTVPLKETSDPEVIGRCIYGLRICVHVACIFGMQLEREAFIPALTNFTNLSNHSEMRLKNYEAVRCLLDIGVKEGDFLEESWKDILTCVSQLDLTQIVNVSTSNSRKPRDQFSEAASQDIVVAVDKIFAKSRHLSGHAVVHFVRALCSLSLEELQVTPPRMYSLTKTVEIAYYNMERVRIEWSHIWAVMGDYFNRVGCMGNEDIAFFAVDSLRQLSIKFLEKGELANFSFQKEFLRPFEYIMSHNKSIKLRDMVVRCVAHMVQSKADNIRSGWKNIFFVFSLAAGDSDQSIVNMAFTTTKHIFENYFSNTRNDHRASLIAASFMDAVNCLAEFASNLHFPDLSMEAIKQLRNCAVAVAEVPELFVDPQQEKVGEPQIWVRGWFPVLFGLSRIINRCKLDVRTRALTVMFEIMKTYGESFLAQWWTDLFRVVFRIFDDKKLASMASQTEKNDWMSTTCTHALRSIVDVVSQYFDTLQGCILGDLLGLLQWCILQQNEQLARTGTECLHILVMNNGFHFTDDSWESVCGCLKHLFSATEPIELMEYGQQELERQEQEAEQARIAADAEEMNGHDSATPAVSESGGATPASEIEQAVPGADAAPLLKEKSRAAERNQQQALFSSIIIKCVVQLELIQTIEWIALSSTRPESTAPPKRTLAKYRISSEDHITLISKSRIESERSVLDHSIDEAGEMFACLSDERLLLLLGCLLRSHEFARKFNGNDNLRTALWKAGFMRNRSKPNLLKQETTSLGCGLRILFRLYESETRSSIHSMVEKQIEDVCTVTLVRFVTSVEPDIREVWSSLINLIIREMLCMDQSRFDHHARLHYDTILECLTLALDSPLGDLAIMLSAFFKRCRSVAL